MKKLLSFILIFALVFLTLPGAMLPGSAKETPITGPALYARDYYFTCAKTTTAAPQGDTAGALQAIKNAITSVEASVNISSYAITVPQLGVLLENEVFQTPSFYYLSGATYNYYPATNIVANVFFNYHYEKSVILTMQSKYEAAVTKALSIIQPSMSDAEKALAIHDYLALHTKFDQENALIGEIPHLSFMAYGALVDGVAVCNGYSLAYVEVISRLGIPVMKVRSSAMSHAWNLIYINNNWYHVDVTFDDPIFSAANGWLNNDYELEGRVEHEYFLLSDSAIQDKGHNNWEPAGYTAGSKIYDGKYLKIVSGMFYNEGYWYYNKNGQLTASRFDLSDSRVLKTVNYSSNKYTYIGMFDGRIYYNLTSADNSLSEIRRIKFDGTNDISVLSINNSGQPVSERITETVIRDNRIKYTVYRWPASGSAQYDVRYWDLNPSAKLEARENSTTVIDPETNFIFGLKDGLTKTEFENNFVFVNGDAKLVYTPSNYVLGTGTKVELVDNTTNEVLESYNILIFGDVNGDGNADSSDSGIIIDMENFLISCDPVDDAALFAAGDLNGDGVSDSIDSSIITDAENFLYTINQVTGLVQ